MLLSRRKLAPLVAELLGTFTLTFIVLSVSKSAIGIPYFIAIGAGLTLAVLIMMIGATSGAHLNPAITFGMWSVKKIGTLKVILYIIAQFIGAVFAWKMYTYLINSTVPSISSKSYDWRIFTAEAVGTLLFSFGFAAAVYQGYDRAKTAATIGGSLIVGLLVASVASNGILNPAVALGVQSWGTEYFIGPVVGALIGFNLYALVFAGESFAIRPPKRVSKPSKVTVTTASAKKKAAKKTSKKK